MTEYYPWAPIEEYVRRRWPLAGQGKVSELGHAAAVPGKFGMGDSATGPMPAVRVRDILGLNRGQYIRARKAGRVNARTADRIATELGVHPCEIWPSWFSDSAAS